MIMIDFNKISDEELAAYLEGMLADKDVALINQGMDLDTYEMFNVSRQAMNEFSSDEIVELPSWDEVEVSSAAIKPLYQPFAMAGFLGDVSVDDEEEENREKQK